MSDPDDWDGHWSSYADSNAWNPAQQWRGELIRSRLSERSTGRKCLVDLGCGQGEFLRSLAADPAWRGSELFGLEGSEVGARIAEACVPTADIRQCDLVSGYGIPPEWTGRATHAVCSEVLEHVDQPFEVLRNGFNLLRPGGLLVVTVPGGPRSAYDKHIGHREHFTPAYLGGLLRAAGFIVDEASGAGWPFFNAYRLGIILYGRRLVQDAPAIEEQGAISDTVSRIVRGLLGWSRPQGRWGWQVVAVARRPKETAIGDS